MDYKQTLHMPQTDFEMRGNLAKKEPGILKQWQQNNYYHEILKHHEGEKAFILHDGPPYANGNLHAGTAMNRSIKDFIVRSHAMLGFYTPFFPGWDTHGLPTENAIQKLGVDRKKITAAEFRKKCDEFVHTQIAQQMETEQRLGQVADYEHPYITLLPEFEERQVKTFGKMASEGMIFQGLKPVYWSPFNETAVADSEIVYRDVKDATIYLAFQIADGKGVLDSDDYYVIWTTTPWTIPSNEAVCLNDNLEYAEVQTEKGKLVFLSKFVDQLLEKFNLENQGVLRTFKGRELEGITYHHVVLDKECPTLLGKHVTDEDGTGVVHTAGGHGLDDFLVCAKYGIAPINTVDYQGNMNEEAGKYQGMFFEDCSKAVIHDMNEKGCLLAVENITHSYPHDDRLKKKVIFRAVKQWFCSIDKLKPQLLDEIDNKITWHNSFGQKRMHNMIADRGVFLDRDSGVYQFLSSIMKMVLQSWNLKYLIILLNCLVNMVLTTGLNMKQRIFYRKDTQIQNLQMVTLQKKRISWTSGSIVDPAGMNCRLEDMIIHVIYTLKAVTSIEAGSTLH